MQHRGFPLLGRNADCVPDREETKTHATTAIDEPDDDDAVCWARTSAGRQLYLYGIYR